MGQVIHLYQNPTNGKLVVDFRGSENFTVQCKHRPLEGILLPLYV